MIQAGQKKFFISWLMSCELMILKSAQEIIHRLVAEPARAAHRNTYSSVMWVVHARTLGGEAGAHTSSEG